MLMLYICLLWHTYAALAQDIPLPGMFCWEKYLHVIQMHFLQAFFLSY